MITVIIPTYNRKALLLRAVESVLRQTHQELECIIVDDASTDGTGAAVQQLDDPRIRYVCMAQNSGACASRNHGLAMARGEYIAWQDSDDFWHDDYLEKQLAFLQEKAADVVVCRMNRHAEDGMRVFPDFGEPTRITYDMLLRESLCSTQCILGRTAVFRDEGFDPEAPRLQDWDLMLRVAQKYRVWLQPDALAEVYVQPDSISSKPEKLLAGLIRLYRKHHAAINAPQRGTALALQWLRQMTQAADNCGAALWTEELLQIAPAWVYRRGQAAAWQRIVIHTAQNEENPAHMEAAQHLYLDLNGVEPGEGGLYLPQILLGDVLAGAAGEVMFAGGKDAHTGGSAAIRTGLTALSAWRGRRYAWDTLAAAYGGASVAAELAAMAVQDMSAWAEALRDVPFSETTAPVRHIGVYYHTIGGGGVQRAAAALIGIWVQMGYRVTLITASEPGAGDYPLPASVRRLTIPAFSPNAPQENRAHTAALARAVQEQGIDLLVHHAWADPLILFDVLAVRSAGCRVLVHTHSVFTLPLLENGMSDRFRALPDVYALCSGIVTLSDADAAYWRHAHPRVYTAVHPLTCRPETTPVNALDHLTVLWSGRLSAEKRPLDAIRVMAEVVRRVPRARMILLGSGDADMTAEVTSLIAASGLQASIDMPGFVSDPETYIQQAAVFLCTSAYEGFGLSMAEAQTHGVPCVTYAMPYLTLLQGGGHVSVPQGDVQAAAQEIVQLLLDGEKRRALGRAARENVESRLNVDQTVLWRRIFAEAAQPMPPLPQDADALMFRTLRTHLTTRPEGGVRTLQTAFVPLPKKGPCKRLRKKAATFLQALLIEGFSGVGRILKEKRRK